MAIEWSLAVNTYIDLHKRGRFTFLWCFLTSILKCLTLAAVYYADTNYFRKAK